MSTFFGLKKKNKVTVIDDKSSILYWHVPH
jgi:hypothetical protein